MKWTQTQTEHFNKSFSEWNANENHSGEMKGWWERCLAKNIPSLLTGFHFEAVPGEAKENVVFCILAQRFFVVGLR